MFSAVPAPRIRSTNRVRSPKDSITAAGPCSSDRATVPSSIAQV
ncbi:hypothetical protein QQM39_07670 [Streptomyces sp. DT2A-34]|nr:hypothetical protein [Streptomyces sp. DT2A-34]MDO0910731.1 hypothetical protein [Streptomyces sp. DT2A-34]